MPHLSISALGTFSATLDGEPIKGFRSAKTEALLVYLMVEHERAHRRDTLTELFWPEQDAKSASTNFRQTLSRLRKILKNKEAEPPFLLVTRQTVQWIADSDFQFDVADLLARLEVDREGGHLRLSSAELIPILDQYSGDFLAGLFIADAPTFDNWVATMRENLHQCMMLGLEQLADRSAQSGDFTIMERAARRQLTLSPWHEAGFRHLMQALAMQGQRNAALAQFDRCFEVLQSELGVEPDAKTEALYEKIATGVIVQAVADTPSLPQPVTPFVGRIAEISHIVRTLSQPDCQLLTLTGAGGSGKTRLALQVAQQVTERLDRPVVFVSLIGVTSTVHAQATLAHALGLTLIDPTTVMQQLASSLHEECGLIVFDNAEPLIAADGSTWAEWLVELLEADLDCQILVTSRQPLRSQVEWVLPVSGLALPIRIDNLTSAQWLKFDAIELFQQRAQQTRVTFALTQQNISDVVQLCRLLGGSPLAIELAAAHLRTHTVAELVADLRAQPAALSAELHNLPPRHRSLQHVFAQSWGLLDSAEQRTLAGCAVFRGGFSRAAAQAILGGDAVHLAMLVDHALLTRREGETAHIRYRMSIPLQAWLDTAQTIPQTVQNRHAAYFLQWTIDHQAHLQTERDNIATAVAWAAQSDMALPEGWRAAWLSEFSAETTPLPSITPPQNTATALIGRDAEMATLRAAFRPIFNHNTPQNGGLITIIGEAGIGKSHLVTQLRRELHAANRAVAWFDCPTDEASAQALLPFRSWLRDYFGQRAEATLDDNLQAFGTRFDDIVGATPDRDLAAELDRLYSLLAALVDLSLPDTLCARLQPEQRRENFQQAIKVLIKAESLLQPVVVHLEDGHWIDEDSSKLLAGLLRHVAAYPFAVVVTTRPSGFKPPLLLDVPQQTLRLEPFKAEAITKLAEHHLDQTPDQSLVDWLQRRGVGNPFFTEQLLRYLRDFGLAAHGRLVHESGTLTDSQLPLDVHNVLAARIDRLEPEVREVISQASVLGREFSLPILREVVGGNGGLLKALDQGEAAAIWQRVSAERYQFSHALLQDTAYRIQFDPERQQRHKAAAQVMVAATTPAKRRHAEIAQHYDAASDTERAVDHYLKAANKARENYFVREAHNYYSRGLTLANTNEQRLQLYLGREAINYWLGNRDEQKADLRQLVGLTSGSEDKRLVADITLRRATFGLAIGSYDESIRLARRATRLAAAIGDNKLQAQAQRSWGRALWQQGNGKSAEPLLKRARRLAAASDDTMAQALCLYDLGMIDYYANQFEAAKQQIVAAQQLFMQLDDKRNLVRCTDLLGTISDIQGEHDIAQGYYQNAMALCRTIDWPYGEAYILAHLGDYYLALGDYRQSRLMHEQALALGRRLDEQRLIVIALDAIGLTYQHEGDSVRAKAQFEAALQLHESVTYPRGKAFVYTHLAQVLIDLEETELAETYLYAALEIRSRAGEQQAAVDTEASLAWLDLARGDLEFAAERAQEVVTTLAENGTKGVEFPMQVYWQCYAVLRAAGNLMEAASILQIAYDALQARAHHHPVGKARERFLTSVPYHKQIMQAWSAQSVD